MRSPTWVRATDATSRTTFTITPKPLNLLHRHFRIDTNPVVNLAPRGSALFTAGGGGNRIPSANFSTRFVVSTGTRWQVLVPKLLIPLRHRRMIQQMIPHKRIKPPKSSGQCEYYYDEETPHRILKKTDSPSPFPPPKMDLSGAWVATILAAGFSAKDRFETFPTVFSSKYPKPYFRNKGRAAKNLFYNMEQMGIPCHEYHVSTLRVRRS